MFEFVRTHQRLMQGLLLLFIFPSFAMVGISSYSHFGDADNAIAKVGAQTITQPEYDAAQREQMQRFQQMFGTQFDPKMFDTAEAKQGVLDNIIAQRALQIEAARQHLSVSDAAVTQSVTGMAGLTGADGKFDGERYRALLAMQGLTPELYEQRLRQDLSLQQLNTAVQNTAFVPKTVVAQLSNINDQERTVQELLFKPADFVSQVKVTPEMLTAFYEKNAKRFEVPEQATVEYVVLSSAAIAAQTVVSDAEVADFYKANMKRFGVDEQRRASHILVNLKKDAPASDKSVAKAKAQQLLEQVRKNPAEFGKIAKASSDDTGTAANGGDLDYFGKGMMTKPFEDAVFKLKEDEISDLVLSDFGYHIIHVTGIKPATFKALDQVKPEIVAEIQKQKAAKQYAALAETFTNTTYEQADSLKPVSDKLKLKVETVANVTRVPNSALGADVLYNNPKFLKALFSDETLKNKRNTEAVEVAPSTLIAGRIVDYKPVSKRPFKDVEASVRERVTATEAAGFAKKAGEAKLAALKATDDVSGFGAEKTVSRAKNDGLESAGFEAVMKADVNKLPALAGADEGDKGYAVYRISKVTQAANGDPARHQAEQQQIANALAQQEMLAYINVLKQKAKVKILKPLASLKSASDKGQDDPAGK